MEFWEAVEYLKNNHLVKRKPEANKHTPIKGVTIELITTKYWN
jgi:hypothetical protein